MIANERAKEYTDRIASSIEHQLETWQKRRQIIRDASQQTTPQPSYDFLASKTERINELTLQSVEGSILSTIAVRRRFVSSLSFQALCRVKLLLDQITRMEPDSKANARSATTLPKQVHKRWVEW